MEWNGMNSKRKKREKETKSLDVSSWSSIWRERWFGLELIFFDFFFFDLYFVFALHSSSLLPSSLSLFVSYLSLFRLSLSSLSFLSFLGGLYMGWAIQKWVVLSVKSVFLCWMDICIMHSMRWKRIFFFFSFSHGVCSDLLLLRFLCVFFIKVSERAGEHGRGYG